MNYFIFVGPPGAGKGTQSALLQERLGFIHVSTGALIRREIESQSELGQSVKNIVESGRYVDDITIVKCLVSHLNSLKDNAHEVILLDGIPRNINQAEAIAELFGTRLKGVIALTAHPEELVERFSKRWHCSNCGRVESFEEPPTQDYICQTCRQAGRFIRRKDDAPDIVLSRFEIYMQQTASLLEFYKARKMLYEFDALQSVEITYVNLASLILQKIDRKC